MGISAMMANVCSAKSICNKYALYGIYNNGNAEPVEPDPSNEDFGLAKNCVQNP
jgi:hypothetical protein